MSERDDYVDDEFPSSFWERTTNRLKTLPPLWHLDWAMAVVGLAVVLAVIALIRR